jgi:hypothetical protein
MLMKSIFDAQVRDDLLSRMHGVTADTRPGWGKMNAEQMLAHLVEAMRMAVGELKPKPKNLLIRYPPLRQLAIYVLPWPKGSPTAPELLPADRRLVDDSKRELVRLVNAVGERATATEWPEHPAFGKMSRRAWGVLGWRHIDHHLRQFGV